MSESFELEVSALVSDPQFAALGEQLRGQSRIESSSSFNAYCREVIRLWRVSFRAGLGNTSALFSELFERIAHGGEQIIKTSWGGVVITRHEAPRVEKYLVIRRGGYLALEKHAEKDERIEVREGAGMLLWRSHPSAPLRVQAILPGDQFHFAPGMEHCLIGTEDLLVFERSVDPKGMDQDLIFIYEPERVAAAGQAAALSPP